MNAVARVLSGLDEVQPALEELYVHLHQHPELSMQETQTAHVVADRLAADGFEVHAVGGGVVGVLRNGEGPCVLFRADMDALPVAEATGLAYASTVTATDQTGATVGVMHACGHDMHVTCGLGAAQALATHREAWQGTYLALFQPGEETAQGARSMVEAGLADLIPKPDVALAQHVLTDPDAGHVATAPGPVLSTGGSIRITLYGKGSHGSMPHLGVDPVVLASAIVLRLQTIVSREIAPSQFGVVTVGSLQAGQKSNIIPDDAVLLVNIRAYDAAVRERLVAGIERIVRGECAAAGSPRDPRFEYYDNYPLTDNDPDVSERVRRAFVAHFGPDRAHHLAPVPASEDFSIVPDALGVPYTFWGLGGFLPGEPRVANHNPAFAPAIQPTLRTGVEAAVTGTLAYLAAEE